MLPDYCPATWTKPAETLDWIQKRQIWNLQIKYIWNKAPAKYTVHYAHLVTEFQLYRIHKVPKKFEIPNKKYYAYKIYLKRISK